MASLEEIVERNYLYDFYGDLLTEHQRKIYEAFAVENYSLSEIAEDEGISRQGVHDLIKRCDKQLIQYEETLHLVQRFQGMRRLVEQMSTELKNEALSDKEKIAFAMSMSEKMLEEL